MWMVAAKLLICACLTRYTPKMNISSRENGINIPFLWLHSFLILRKGGLSPNKKKKRNCQSEFKKTNSKPKRWWCRQYYQQQTIALRIILPHFKYLLKLKCGFLILPHKIAASYLCLSVLVNSILPYPSMLQNDLYIFNIARCIYRKFHFNSNSFCFIIRLLFVFHFECLFHRQIQKSKTKERDERTKTHF